MPVSNAGQAEPGPPPPPQMSQPAPQPRIYSGPPPQVQMYQPSPLMYPQPQPPMYVRQPQWADPVPRPKRPAAELGVLVGGSVLILVVGGLTMALGLFAWAGIFLVPEYSNAPRDEAADRLLASVLFPGPVVALAAAWAGYGILRRLSLRVAGLVLFGAVLLAWLLILAVVAGPVLL